MDDILNIDYVYFYNRVSQIYHSQLQLINSFASDTGGAFLSPPVKYFTDRSKVELLSLIFYVFFCLVFAMPCARMFICTLWSPAGKRADLLALVVVSNCEFVTFPLVSWVRCGT